MKVLFPILVVAFGGSLGAVFRYVSSTYCATLLSSFPLGTLFVNFLGCLLVGIFYGVLDRTILPSNHVRLFLITGFCGALTTMSSFIYEVDNLMKNGQNVSSLFYAFLTLAGSFALFLAGNGIVRYIGALK